VLVLAVFLNCFIIVIVIVVVICDNAGSVSCYRNVRQLISCTLTRNNSITSW